jgi:hypothetical protein
MDPVLLAALIRQFALPELIDWIKAKHAAGQVITNQVAREKLGVDADAGIAVSKAWLEANPKV